MTNHRIERVEAVPVALPVRREWRWRGLGGNLGRWVIVRLATDEGLVGLGEATALPDWGGDFNRYAGETPTTVVHVVEHFLQPLLLGSDPFDIERLLVAMDETVSGQNYAKAAAEMALHDLQGKIAGQPLYRLLGGKFRPGVVIAHMIGIMSASEAVEEGRAAVDDGCRAFQIKGTGELARDVAVVRALREALGSEIVLRLDANQGYRRLGAKQAARAMDQLVDAGTDLLEQPVEGLREMAAIRASVTVPVIADESCWTPEDLVDVVDAGAADAISIYVAKAGGLARARRIAQLAEVYGLPCDVNGSLESGVGNAASVHFATAMPAISLPCVIPVTATAGVGTPLTCGRYYRDDLVSEPFPFEDGMLMAPERPGLGVELDEEKLAAYRVSVE